MQPSAHTTNDNFRGEASIFILKALRSQNRHGFYLEDKRVLASREFCLAGAKYRVFKIKNANVWLSTPNPQAIHKTV